MTIAYSNVTVSNSETFQTWLTRTNQLVTALKLYSVTTDSNAAVGNSSITGSFTGNSLIGTSSVFSPQIGNTTSRVDGANVYSSQYFVGAGDYLATLNASALSQGTIPNARITGSYSAFVNITASGTILAPTIGNTSSQVNAANVNATQFIGGGGNLSSLNASALSQGLVPSARLAGAYTAFSNVVANTFIYAPTIGNTSSQVFGSNVTATYYVGGGDYLTSLNASSLSQGTVPNTRISGSYTGFTTLVATTSVISPIIGNTTSQVNAANVNATNIIGNHYGNGSNLTSIPAGQLTGTVANAQISGSYTGFTTIVASTSIIAPTIGNTSSAIVGSTITGAHSGDGSSLTNLNASNLGSGTVPDARIAATIMRTSSYTASDVLSKLLTVDGSGSLLDADTLDGQHASDFASLASPAFTGTPTAPTAANNTSTTQIATTAYVQTASLNGAAGKANTADPAFTGVPTAPTAANSTNTTQIATTAFVKNNITNLGSMSLQNSSAVSITGGTITGITDLAVADGGTGASTQAGARTGLGLGTMSTQDASAVSITGGSATLTGSLTVSATNAQIYLNKVNGTSAIVSNNSGVNRWYLQLGDGSTESGANAGSDYYLSRFADNGTNLGIAMSIIRSTGNAAFGASLSVSGSMTVAGAGGLGVTAGGFSVAGATYLTGALTVSADIATLRSGSPTTGAVYFGNSGSRPIYWDATQFNFYGPANVSGYLNIAGAFSGATTGAFSSTLNVGGSANIAGTAITSTRTDIAGLLTTTTAIYPGNESYFNLNLTGGGASVPAITFDSSNDRFEYVRSSDSFRWLIGGSVVGSLTSSTGLSVYGIALNSGNLTGALGITGATLNATTGVYSDIFLRRSDTNRTITWGSGSPEGVGFGSSVGSLYLRTDGGASTTLYIKTSGTGNTGWTAK